MNNQVLSKKKRRKLALNEIELLLDKYKVEASDRGELSRNIIGILFKYYLHKWTRQKIVYT